ncbi:MAG: hypothetical protein M3P18_00605 [Actinomycetota bacterium]|nr:hypothetical protein [Actinomycetota bacterium]
MEPQSLESLEQLSADVAVMACDGLRADGGLTTPHQLVAEIGTSLVMPARHVIVVADSSKVGRRGSPGAEDPARSSHQRVCPDFR